jgi:hypothetical protein
MRVHERREASYLIRLQDVQLDGRHRGDGGGEDAT